jgi:formamidopyrimidine-DNA glycosylase
MVIHLGMTGQLTIVPASTSRKDHTHLIIGLDGGACQMRLRDVRRFGSALLLSDSAALQEFFHNSALGPEPFGLDKDYLHARLAATKRCLKAVLLDQAVVAGVGNIYADESLFESRLHPAQPGHATSRRQARRLQESIVAVLERAIAKRGSSIRDYIGGSGERGEYQDEFRVYGRTGKPCVRCGATIRCLRLAGRSTHFCPRCQPLRRPHRLGERQRRRKEAAGC